MNEFLKSIDYGQFLDRIAVDSNQEADEARGDKPLEWTGTMLPGTAGNTDKPPKAPVDNEEPGGQQNLSMAARIERHELKAAGYTPEQMARVLARRKQTA